jgi:hypothetical protein
MTEPTNPLFEDEKDFLERKKLEYERALRGDVEEIKENTVQAGKVALVGAGVIGGIWLLVKAFSGGKAKKKKHKHRKSSHEFEDYAGFDGFDENDQELNDLANDFQSSDYDEDPNYAYAGADADGFYTEGQGDAGYADEDDDNGLSQYPDFPAHSASYQSNEEVPGESYGEDTDQEKSYPYSSSASYQARPYDDSRRLPESNSFAEDDFDSENDFDSKASAPAEPVEAPKSKLSIVGPALMSFAQSETGRVIVAQAAAVALALVTKAVQGFMPKHEAEADKNADLAASSVSEGVQPATWPATSAQDASAAARHDDTLSFREPLA